MCVVTPLLANVAANATGRIEHEPVIALSVWCGGAYVGKPLRNLRQEVERLPQCALSIGHVGAGAGVDALERGTPHVCVGARPYEVCPSRMPIQFLHLCIRYPTIHYTHCNSMYCAVAVAVARGL